MQANHYQVVGTQRILPTKKRDVDGEQGSNDLDWVEQNRPPLWCGKKQVNTVDKLRKYKLYSIFCLWSPPQDLAN